MEKQISIEDREIIAKMIMEGIELPQDLKYLLFPTEQKEYELVYAGKMRKEDILANEDGVFPVPLQIDKTFNSGKYKEFEDGWKNMIVFGDNLQLLKTIYENKDSIILDKVKGKVKLVYIDPPFATEADFKANQGQKAYTDKIKGSEFIEFFRKRLILTKEILADDGIIAVHLDSKKGHYVKIILDEIFGENNFLNDIIWQSTTASKYQTNSFPKTYSNIYIYRKTKNYTFNRQYTDFTEKYINDFYKYEEEGTERIYRISDFTQKGEGQAKEFGEKGLISPPKGKHWIWSQERINEGLKKGVILFSSNGMPGLKRYLDERKGNPIRDIWNDINDIPPKSQERLDYPTQKPEKLIERIISSFSDKGDIIFDFFGGSGTTAAVAEKLGRKWIVCDIGKYSYYTIQKRILTIQESKDIENPKKKYGKNAKSFITAQLGLYHLDKVIGLQENKYKNFVMELFEIEEKKHKIAGMEFDGKKGEYPVRIFPHWKEEFRDTSIDEEYLENVNSIIKKKQYSRVYFIAPANYFDFITDYHEIDGTRYYFLKIPYQVIKELHKIPFQKLRKPQSKNNVNALDGAVGFHFIRQPEVKSKIEIKNERIIVKLLEFRSQYYKDEEGKILDNFETLAMILIDSQHKNDEFIMRRIEFADDLMKIKNKDEGTEELIREKLKKQSEIIIEFNKDEVDKNIMLIYIDIYGNEFREKFTIGEVE